MKTTLRFVYSVAALVLCVLSFNVKAQSNILYFIFDASGSMWEQVDGKPRIEIAKETLSSLIDQTPADIRSGVTAYGHRRKFDCADIEEVAPLQSLGPVTTVSYTHLRLPPILHV